jgi:hypothetical protein
MCNPPIAQARQHFVIDRVALPKTLDTLGETKTLEQKLKQNDIAALPLPQQVMAHDDLYWLCADEMTLRQAERDLPYARECLAYRETCVLDAYNAAGKAQSRYDSAVERDCPTAKQLELASAALREHARKDELGDSSHAQAHLVLYLESMPLFREGPSAETALGRFYFLPCDVFDGTEPLDFLKTL